MTPEEIDAMKKENEELNTYKNETEPKIGELEKELEKKDSIIEQKTKDVVGARKKYKKLDELSDEEKENMSEIDIARKKENDELFERQEQAEKQAEEARKIEAGEKRATAIKNLVGDDSELAEKIEKNYSMIKGADIALTQDEVASFVNTAFNMLGDDKPEPIRSTLNAGGGVPPAGDETGGFTATERGKSLSKEMGLPSANADEDNTPPAQT